MRILINALKTHNLKYKLDETTYKIICSKKVEKEEEEEEVQENYQDLRDNTLRMKIKLLRKEDTNELVLQFTRLNGLGFDFIEIYQLLQVEIGLLESN